MCGTIAWSVDLLPEAIVLRAGLEEDEAKVLHSFAVRGRREIRVRDKGARPMSGWPDGGNLAACLAT